LHWAQLMTEGWLAKESTECETARAALTLMTSRSKGHESNLYGIGRRTSEAPRLTRI
jgi:hypothetical protein